MGNPKIKLKSLRKRGAQEMQTYCIPVEHVNDGDILAKDVKNTRGIILVPRDCTINSYLKVI